MNYEEIVVQKIRARKMAGLKKYGVGVERTDLSTIDWLNHAQQESMDLSIYLERLIQNQAAHSIYHERLIQNQAALEATIRELFAADEEYGCGFYNTDRWRTAYDKLREMVKSQ